MHLYSAIAFSITLSLRLLIINTYPSQRLRGWNGRWPSWRRAQQTPEIPTKTLVPERFLENSNLAPTNHGRICETLTSKELDLAPLTLARRPQISNKEDLTPITGGEQEQIFERKK
jgi:hypothetical protein